MPFITKLGSVAARAYGWLAAVAQAVVSSDAYFYLVSILLPGNGTNGATNNTFLDSSTNNFTITRNGNTTQGTFTPFSQTGWSNYFDGSGDYLQLPAGSATTIFGGALAANRTFTIECWVYHIAYTASTIPVVIGDMTPVSSTNYWSFGTNSTGQLVLFWFDGVERRAVGNTVIPLSTWAHIAVSIQSGAIKLFVNGVQQTITGTSTLTNATGSNGFIAIGQWVTTNVFSGYISNLRVVKDVAVYSASFAPFTAPLTAISGTSLLTCQNNRFVDNSANNLTITRNGDVAVTANSPFAPNNITPTSYSGYFDGSGDYLNSAVSSGILPTTGSFTIEFWYYKINTGNRLLICGNANGSICIQDSGTAISVSRYNVAFIQQPAYTNPLNTWVHLAVVRNGNTYTTYINGTSIGTATDSNTLVDGTVFIGKNPGNTVEDLQGLISNLRIVKGTAVYTSNFTPPTVPLTAISGTSLLTCQSPTFIDNSTNAFAITVSGNTQPVTTNPFQAPTPSPVSYSGQFDGTGDYLTVPNNAALTFATGDWTAECWCYPTVAGTASCLFARRATGVTFGALSLNQESGGLNLLCGDGTNFVINITGSSMTLNVWNHVAVTRSGSTFRIFLNGAVVATGTSSATLDSSSSVFSIGAFGNGADIFDGGLISNFRFVKGTAVYTSNFTPPTAPLTAISGTSLLTCQSNRFVDNSSNAFAITVNGDTRPVINSPFGYQTPISSTAYSGYFDGSGDFLTAPAAAVNFGTGDFTVEFWLNLGSAAGNYQSMFFFTHSGGTFVIRFGSTTDYSSYLQVSIVTSAASNVYSTNLSQSALSGRWAHVAFTRQSSTCRVFVDGVQQSLGTGVTPSSFPLSSFSNSTNITSPSTVYIASDTVPNAFTGLISNLRVVNGTAVYTAAFTPPTSPLTAIANTSLLTCQNSTFIDNSTNAFTITVNGNAATTSVNPFGYSFPIAPTSVSYSALTNGGSGYFDGSGDYLTAPANAAFNMGGPSNNFTIECWVYQTANSGVRGVLGPRPSTGGGNDGGYGIYLDNGVATFQVWTFGAFAADTALGPTVPLNTWTHIAGVRFNSQIRVYVNGIGGTPVSATRTGDNSSPFYVGTYEGAVYPFTGLISNARAVKGTAVYTSNFTPPTAPLTAISGTSLLLNYTNAGIADAASQNVLETVGNAQISTAQSKWGGGSMLFDGTGDWLLIPHQPPQFLSTGNFTIEMWVYRNSSGTYGLVGKGTATTGWLVSLNSSNQVVFTYGSSTITSTGTVAATTWAFITVVREGTGANQTKIYINGTNDGTGTVSTDFNQTNVMYVGADRTGGSNFNGYIDDLRITKFARYTANFTPPTAAFPTQ